MIVFNCLQVIINSYNKNIHPLNHYEIIDINKSSPCELPGVHSQSEWYGARSE